MAFQAFAFACRDLFPSLWIAGCRLCLRRSAAVQRSQIGDNAPDRVRRQLIERRHLRARDPRAHILKQVRIGRPMLKAARKRRAAIPASFSYGAFELKSGEDAATAMARADEAMYAQKRGR